MASSRRQRDRIVVAALGAMAAFAPSLGAQQALQGFAVERFYPSAPGGGWFVMDDLNIGGGLSGAIDVTAGYARNSVVIPGSTGGRRFALVSSAALVDVGAAASYDRYRVYVDIPVPALVSGTGGSFGLYTLTAPAVTPGTNPDTIGDTTLGFDARLFGERGGRMRLGAGAQLIFPSGDRGDYVTDARYRGMFRFLAAGDAGNYSYAGQLGVHVRPLRIAALPEGPDGNEFLFGISGGRKITLSKGWRLVVGPEIYGETAFRAFFNGSTGTEVLFTSRWERLGSGPGWRIRAGIGHGVVEHFGAPQWRVLAGVELFAQR